jgi:hypothetical protein
LASRELSTGSNARSRVATGVFICEVLRSRDVA